MFDVNTSFLIAHLSFLKYWNIKIKNWMFMRNPTLNTDNYKIKILIIPQNVENTLYSEV